MIKPKFRLIQIDTDNRAEWQDFHSSIDAYNAQDNLIKGYNEQGFTGFYRHFLEKGVGHTFQCVEIYLVYAESGRVI